MNHVTLHHANKMSSFLNPHCYCRLIPSVNVICEPIFDFLVWIDLNGYTFYGLSLFHLTLRRSCLGRLIGKFPKNPFPRAYSTHFVFVNKRRGKCQKYVKFYFQLNSSYFPNLIQLLAYQLINQLIKTLLFKYVSLKLIVILLEVS